MISVTEEQVFDVLKEIYDKKYQNPSVQEYLMNCYFKLLVKYPKSSGMIRLLIEDKKKSYSCEVQQRAIEYSVFGKLMDLSIKENLTRNIPNSKLVKESNVQK